jgi:hypothetical protein
MREGGGDDLVDGLLDDLVDDLLDIPRVCDGWWGGLLSESENVHEVPCRVGVVGQAASCEALGGGVTGCLLSSSYGCSNTDTSLEAQIAMFMVLTDHAAIFRRTLSESNTKISRANNGREQ